MDIFAYNRQAWDRQVGKGCQWTAPVGREMITAARHPLAKYIPAFLATRALKSSHA